VARIYKLRPGLSTWYYWFGEMENWPTWPNIKDIHDALKAMKMQKITWEAQSGGRHADQCLFSMFSTFSKKFIDLLRENNITNFTPFPFKIVKPEDSPAYYYLEIDCKPIKRLTEKAKGLMDLGTEVYFDIAEWGGEDIFKVEGTYSILCTEEVKIIVEKNKLKNFRFIEIKQVKEG